MAPQIILFADNNFNGAHKHILQDESFVSDFNDVTSSIIVLEGTWQCFEDANFNGRQSMLLGPGRYPFVGNANVNIDNDTLSSVRLIHA